MLRKIETDWAQWVGWCCSVMLVRHSLFGGAAGRRPRRVAAASKRQAVSEWGPDRAHWCTSRKKTAPADEKCSRAAINFQRRTCVRPSTVWQWPKWSADAISSVSERQLAWRPRSCAKSLANLHYCTPSVQCIFLCEQYIVCALNYRYANMAPVTFKSNNSR